MSSNNLLESWQSVLSSVDGTIDALNKIQDERLSFGITVLDEIFHGFIRNDIILIGAGSGVGKTQLAILLATALAKQKVRVGMLALEAMKFEITMRIAYSLSNGKFKTYRNFLFDTDRNERTETVRKIFSDFPQSELIKVFYKTDTFGIEELRRELYAMENYADVIILDHFHFLDLLGEKSEIQEQKEIVAELNRLQKLIGKPIIVLGQYNKPGARTPLAGLGDFYGTSALTNMVTKAITISQVMPDGVTLSPDTDTRRKTLFGFPKCRLDGSVTRFFAIASYDLSQNKYEDKYLLYKLGSKSPVTLLEKPDWAKSSIDLTPYSN